MGVSGKWIKTLIGLKKSEKPKSWKKDENRTDNTKLGLRRSHSVEIDAEKIHYEFDGSAVQLVGDATIPSNPNAAGLPSDSLHIHDVSYSQQNDREEWAAVRIQTGFRGFLARRDLRALKGLVRLQALVRGHAVRKQAAITLRCMQALVRVQARVRARHVRLALESQTAPQNIEEQLPNEAHGKQIEEGWCDSVGSVEEIQAKLLKRQEAEAKRERAMAYALTHQWQARSRQQAHPLRFEPDKNSWGWNWLERWMAVRPWENRFLDTNVNDGVIVLENGSSQGKNGIITPLKIPGKKPIVSTLHTNLSSQKTVPSHSDKANSGSGINSRSQSNPKERSIQPDKQAKKRLSLPSSTGGPPYNKTSRDSSKTAVKATPSSLKPMKEKLKLNGGSDSDPTKPTTHASDV